MSWLALLLIGIATTDLAHSLWRRRVVPEALGGLVVVAVALAAGFDSQRDVGALVVVVAVVLAWGQTVTWGFSRRGRPWVPLLVLGLGLTAAVVAAPWAGPVDGPIADWLARDPLPALAETSPERVLLVAGLVLAQMSTGNVLVRLVLSATGTMNPAQHGTASDPEMKLKGGRLLGPMERLLIFGLGLAGEFTAAGIVIAAKGLLRFPELQSKGEQERIHQLTEYFLVGSFVSWLIPLGSLVLLS